MLTKTRTMRLIEHERGAPIEALLRDRLSAGMTIEQIAADLEVSNYAISSWVDQMGGKRRIVWEFSEPAGAGR